jgi:hypothetical protein
MLNFVQLENLIEQGFCLNFEHQNSGYAFPRSTRQRDAGAEWPLGRGVAIGQGLNCAETILCSPKKLLHVGPTPSGFLQGGPCFHAQAGGG